MGPLKNPFHEAFGRAVVSRKFPSNTAAYKSVRPHLSDNVAKVKAHEIMRRPDVKARLEELTGRWSREPEVEARIAERTIEKVSERMSEKMVLTREWVVDQLIEVANRAMQKVAVLDSEGAPTGEWKYDGSVAIRALELLGKECGMFIERSVSMNVHYAISEEPMSPEDWAKKYGDQAQIN
jgi:hypothetical protein